MSLATRNIDALNEYQGALQLYREYTSNKDRNILQEAIKKFEKSIRIDPKFFLPKYYRAVVNDMVGDYKAAANELLQLRVNPPKQYEPLVKYALGIALYHHYLPDKLKEAIDFFSQVQGGKTRGLQAVRNLAQAGKLQAEAVLIMFENRKPENFAKAFKDKTRIEDSGKELIDQILEHEPLSSQEREALWITYNAVGLANMYVSDSIRYLPEKSNQKKQFLSELKTAHDYFILAEGITGPHWAIRSNLGSLQNRKAKFHFFSKDSNADEEFKESLKIFEDLLQNVRNDYDFAYYEMGKAYRYWHRYPSAIEMFRKSLEAGKVAGENLPAETILRQIAKAENNEDSL